MLFLFSFWVEPNLMKIVLADTDDTLVNISCSSDLMSETCSNRSSDIVEFQCCFTVCCHQKVESN